MKYIATVGMSNDETGKAFKPGETVEDGDFPKYIIADWLKRGRLVEEEKEEEATDGSDDLDREI